MRIEIVVFDGLDELDAILPFEVFQNAVRSGADWDVALVGVRGGGDIVGGHGLRFHADAGLAKPDALVVPGGGWAACAATGAWQQAQGGYLPDRIRTVAPNCQWVAAVCTGAMLLAAAGLTDGRPATTHHKSHDDLRASGAKLIPEARVVDDGDLLTCGGVTAGLDLALWIVERELGPQTATAIAANMEHERTGTIWRAAAASG